MAKKTTAKEDAINAALTLTAERGWDNIGLSDIAEAGSLSLSDLYEYFDDKGDILSAYGRMVDRKVLEAVNNEDETATPRDRLFEIMMERFDVLNENREAVISILKSFCFDPKQAVISLPHLGKSMSWMLEAAGEDTGGIRGAVKVAGLTGIYLNVLRTWKEDDSPDMSKTMAALDRNLNRAEQVANSFLI